MHFKGNIFLTESRIESTTIGKLSRCTADRAIGQICNSCDPNNWYVKHALKAVTSLNHASMMSLALHKKNTINLLIYAQKLEGRHMPEPLTG